MLTPIMRNAFTKTCAAVVVIFAVLMMLGTFSGCKSADDPNVAPAPAISGTFSITKVETTPDSGKTWTPKAVDCLASGVFTFNSPNIMVYKKSTCQGDGDFTGTWMFYPTSKELTINMANGDNWWDGIVKDATGTSFVLDESAILNAKFNDRVTFTKK
ncbi:MAG: hypothetical protein M3O71_12705 [Bacteroidota bacterium]|nr:hypothetical protein [Bacteroidota bacterium]